MKRVRVIALTTFLESFRRKDFFVLAILAAAIIGGAGMVRVFGMGGFSAFVSQIALFVITWSAILIAVTSAARQMPAEIANRTLYPLLAKPLSRFEFLLGKFVGVNLMCLFSLAVLYAIFLVVAWRAGTLPGWILLQNFYLRMLSLALLVAMTLCFSLVLTHAANVCLSLLVAVGISTFSTALSLVHDQLSGAPLRLAEAAYYILPHLDLFNLNAKVVAGWDPVAAWALLYLTVYALAYVALLLSAAAWLFQRRTL